MSEKRIPESPERRGFLKKTLAVILGSVSGLVPAAAGLFVFLDPLRRKSQAGGAVLVTTLNALPEDGVPRKFPVIASHTDAWNCTPEARVGAVYLRRTAGQPVQALNVVCPHAGCFADYQPEQKVFHCPCHNSAFGLDGKINDPKSPSPRGLDTLEVEIRNGSEVWVKFQNFRAGKHEKIPV
jgi:menaquinol-cytochrome c reductase iron-sulfur subunit